MTDYVLTLYCPDRVGVVSAVASLLSQANAFITDISQYSDSESRLFSSRTVFDDREMDGGFKAFSGEMTRLAGAMDMHYVLRPLECKQKVVIAVSQYDHCLNALLTKWHSGVLPIDIVGVVSNHRVCEAMTRFYQLPFHHLPVSAETKPEQEQRLRVLMEGVDLLVLARYMQILSADFCLDFPAKVINIHHSFLPGFKGARPYHQAHARGVKVIGATAHYVTPDLDEGPIIVQEVRSIDHRVTVPQMVHIGHDLEATALATAVKLHTEERVVVNGVRTVTL
ncbi:MAG: formyltetrahydrofolate deformylase [Candidatus Azotimanducaceae bacterium]|jgi:formyltetrahydrofolate deformylase